MKRKIVWLAGSCLMAVMLLLASCGQLVVEEEELVTPEESAEWETHTYQNEEMGFAFSFTSPSKWLATGPVGERQIGGWYDPAYAKPPSPDAIWCYWITCSPSNPEVPDDPIMLAPTQKRVTTQRVQGDWSYHLMCVAPTAIFNEQTAVFNRIMESLKPLP